MDTERTTPDETTRRAEAQEANRDHVAGDPAEPEDGHDADMARADPAQSDNPADVAEHYREMTERGAHQKGEGRID